MGVMITYHAYNNYIQQVEQKHGYTLYTAKYGILQRMLTENFQNNDLTQA